MAIRLWPQDYERKVTATYSIGEEPVGVMGIIGPTRMQYGKVVSVLEYMRMSLGAILTNLLEEE